VTKSWLEKRSGLSGSTSPSTAIQRADRSIELGEWIGDADLPYVLPFEHADDAVAGYGAAFLELPDIIAQVADGHT